MSSVNGPQRRYSVSMSKAQRAHLRQLRQQEDTLGQGQRFVSAYREIVRRLQRDPQVFGEKLYTLPVLKLDIRQAVFDRIVVDYGVHEERKMVFIRGFKLLS